MSKTIVTHISPDLDAISSSWLVLRYMPGWDEADFAFVPAGSTFQNAPPDDDPDIIHVDTGMGKFDHHQFSERLSAAKVVFRYLKEEVELKQKDMEGLERMVEFITLIDNFAEVNFPEPTNDRYEFLLSHAIEGMRGVIPDNKKLMEAVFPMLDGILQIFKNKIHAEKEIKEGFVFQSKWGKSLALETKNEETMKLSLKMGFALVVRRDPDKENIRIKTLPEKKYDLTAVHEVILKKDKKATWFLHASKNMLLNGSAKKPNAVPSALSLQQVIEIIKKI